MKQVVTLLLVLLSTVLIAQTPAQHTIDVTGMGVVHIVPDNVTVSVRVENTGKEAKAVKQLNDATISEVLSFVKSMKIADKDIQTAYISLSKNHEYNTKTYNYAANQSMKIKLRDLSQYEKLLNGLLESGVNRIEGVSFSSSEIKQLESQARKNAMLNAKMKATEYAGALDQTIGKALSISEFTQGATSPPMYKMALRMDDRASGGDTIAPGELEIRVTVNVSFALN
ncbi:MAG: hypothetical protein ACI86C_000335 [Candidatus Latescibacterota bacterium]|jgi:uncharacterized protein YggE